MNKSGTLIISALLTFGLAAGAMAADMPKSAAPMAADTPARLHLRPSRRRKPSQEARSKKAQKKSRLACPCDNQVRLLV